MAGYIRIYKYQKKTPPPLIEGLNDVSVELILTNQLGPNIELAKRKRCVKATRPGHRTVVRVCGYIFPSCQLNRGLLIFFFFLPQSLESIQPTRVPSAASSNLRMEPGTRTLPPSPTNWRARSPVSFASSKSLPICLHVGVSPVSSPVTGCSLSGRFAQMHILRDVEGEKKKKTPGLFLLNIVNSVTCLRALH